MTKLDMINIIDQLEYVLHNCVIVLIIAFLKLSYNISLTSESGSKSTR